MKLSQKVYMLEVAGGKNTLYLTLIRTQDDVILVDTGYPMQYEPLKAAIEAEGVLVSDITKIILTHQDIDHIGCAREVLAQAPKAQLLAHSIEAPYIDGRETPVKLAMLERLGENMPDALLAVYKNLGDGFANRRHKIDVLLEDGARIGADAGIRVLHTPGHTPGHICLFVEDGGVLVTGDALNLSEGRLCGPNPQYTQDMDEAMRSLKKCLDFDIRSAVVYHGGLISGDVNAQIERIIEG